MTEFPGTPDYPGATEPAEAPPPVTGNPAVDAVLRQLTEVGGQAPADQLPAYQAAHRSLRETLASIDEEGRAD